MKKIIVFLSFFLLIWCSSTPEIESNFVADKTTLEDMKNWFLWTKTILTLGDSLTAWYWVQSDDNYPSKLERKLREEWYSVDIINAWVSWETSAWALQRVENYEPSDIVIITIWWNDGLRNTSLSDMKSNIESIIDYYIAEWSSVVLSGMEIPAIYWLKYSRDFKNIYFEVADTYGDKIYFYESFLKDVGWVAKYNQSDAIHPNAQWYDIIVDNLYEYFINQNIIESSK